MGSLQKILSLFERKYSSEYMDSEGILRNIKISKSKINELLNRGVLEKLIEVHILDSVSGCRIEKWKLQDIGIDNYQKFKAENGELYVVSYLKESNPKMMIMSRKRWDEMAMQYSEIEKVYAGEKE